MKFLIKTTKLLIPIDMRHHPKKQKTYLSSFQLNTLRLESSHYSVPERRSLKTMRTRPSECIAAQ